MAEPFRPPNVPHPYDPAGAAPYPQPSSSRSKRPWIITGVVLAVVVLAGVAAVLVSRKTADDGYTARQVVNSCDVVDTSVIEKWVPRTGAQPEHKETRTGPITMLECSAENKSADESKLASIALIATVDEQPSMGIQPIQLPLGPETSGSDREEGAVTGLGEEAHYYWSKGSSTSYSWVASVYQLEVRDANLDVSVTLQVVGGTRDDLAAVAETQVRQVMDELRK